MHGEKGERMDLSHEPVPGYKRIFYVALAMGLLHLAGIFLYGFMRGPH